MEERLQKYMARCGVASRRKCEELITNEVVKVNGKLVTELGAKIDPLCDQVYVNDKLIKPESEKIYIVLNKPEGYISSVKDEKNRPTIVDLINLKERIYPIGRLDYDTSGLILLTNDGEVYNNVIHPRKQINKVYEATIQGSLLKEDKNKFEAGIDIGGYITAPSKIDVLNVKKGVSKVRITIHEGKNRQIRRMCEAINHPVITLKRLSVGEITLGDLKLGQWRFLQGHEVDYIKKL
jgi:pseudouridine synthase